MLSFKSRASLFQILALVALILIPLIVLRTLESPSGLATQPQPVGFIFIVICVLGAIVGVRPSAFSRSFSRKSMQEEGDGSQVTDEPEQKLALRGHHFSCESFSDHVIRHGNNVYCAGCTGLTTGAVISILGGLTYFFFGVAFFDEVVVFWVGVSCVFLGLLQHQFYRLLSIRSGLLRFTLNVLFVVGAFLILMGANRITGDLTVDLYIISVILLWILARIMMSKGEHQKICLQCDDESCSQSVL